MAVSGGGGGGGGGAVVYVAKLRASAQPKYGPGAGWQRPVLGPGSGTATACPGGTELVPGTVAIDVQVRAGL